ncbi:hypothetical protein [Bifidobacterium sp. ESL0764]|uniref:hypothetical protein n=1 Tax=Bifidobacterium sp. ESL0764 TaxID=2983228 RepID=UPI0023F75A9A|nr:hypothetical protein [Bifidobacterium sp. ESL0764]WEV65553.1 hypothetical protein OZX71_07335 [Bifidobacterium sp. ESL0764]
MDKFEQTTMVANFDSMEQLKQWMRISDSLKIPANGVLNGEAGKISDSEASKQAQLANGLWSQSAGKSNCERFLNSYPQFASCFAGIIRTAYLYAPRIVVTVADLFDGVFFVALGPKAVNGILGTSYKDGAKLVVSGMEHTLEQSLVSFIAGPENRKNTDTQEGASKAAKIQTKEKTYCTLDGRLIGLSPEFKGASLGWGTHLSARSVNPDESQVCDLVQKQKVCGETGIGSGAVARTLVGALLKTLSIQDSIRSKQSGISIEDAQALYGGKTRALQWFDFLAMRWQEWLDAEKRGEIIYQEQKNHQFAERFKNVVQSAPVQEAAKGFVYDADSYDDVGVKIPVLPKDVKKRKAVTDWISEYDSDKRRAVTARIVVENNICARSQALELFKDIYENGDGTKNEKNKDEKHKEQKWFEGWYEYIYQKAMADHIGECLKADVQEAPQRELNRAQTVTGNGKANKSDDSATTQEREESQFGDGFCNLIYVSNKEERPREQNVSFVDKTWKNIKKGACVAWCWSKRRLGWKTIPEDIDTDDLDGQIYVDNCFLDRVRELARKASKSMDNAEKGANGKNTENGGETQTNGIHTLFGPVTDTLRHMPHSKFQTFCYESRGAIERWRLNGADKGNTRDVGYCILQACSQHTLSSQDMGLKEDTALALVLALVAVLIDLVLPGNALPLVLMVFLSWIISTLPSFINLHRWKKEVQSSGETVLIDG